MTIFAMSGSSEIGTTSTNCINSCYYSSNAVLIVFRSNSCAWYLMSCFFPKYCAIVFRIFASLDMVYSGVEFEVAN